TGTHQRDRHRILRHLPAQVAHEIAAGGVACIVHRLIDDLARADARAELGERLLDANARRLRFTLKLLAGSHHRSFPRHSPDVWRELRLPAADGWSFAERGSSS